MGTVGTKERILDAAEELFANRGFAATSLRAITGAAGVNLAAVNYHFGTKEELLCAVVVRRLSPVNETRLALLRTIESQDGCNAANLEEILRAFIAPVFGLSGEGAFPRLMGRLYSEPLEHISELYEEECREVFRCFCDSLGRALPGMDRAELFWRIQFILGMVTHTLMAGDRIRLCTEGLCNIDDIDEVIDRMARFAAAGLRADSPTKSPSTGKAD